MGRNSEDQQHLDATLVKIGSALGQATGLLAGIDGAYHDTKHYLVESRGEIDPSEMFQSELALSEVDRRAAVASASKTQLEKLLDSPYFARIDFAVEGGEGTETYLGRFAFRFGNESVISDWRAPVASLFYDYDLGAAEYEAPTGRVRGAITGKRQFRIEHGRLVYAVDSASSVRDEVLQRELSRTSDRKMRTIISSIQKEQNAIIRDERPGTLVIQGVAGSGKTSIALHRIAYLLYRQKERLTSKSVIILSPNRVFGDYISNVLPELGEEPVGERSLYAVAADALREVARVQQPRSFVDDTDDVWRERARRKGTPAFARQLCDYLEGVGDGLFQSRDLELGRRTLEGPWLAARWAVYGNLAVSERLDLVTSDALAELYARSYGRERLSLPSKRDVRKRLESMLEAKDPLTLYRRFLEETEQLELLSIPAKGTVEWEDAYPLVLLRSAFRGIDEYADVQHLVVDEMQDLTPVQHLVIARLFPCDKTILGDCFQMVDGRDGLDEQQVADYYPGARTARLMRSYRSTYEIVELARRIKPIPGLEAVARHGAEPRVQACRDTQDVLDRLGALIADFQASDHRTLGILHKSEDLAQRYAELLARDYEVHFAAQDSATFSEGVTVASVKMAKGLEFDEVVVLDVDSQQYAAPSDRNLLYVAVTRAMHRLTLLHRGRPSGFLSE